MPARPPQPGRTAWPARGRRPSRLAGRGSGKLLQVFVVGAGRAGGALAGALAAAGVPVLGVQGRARPFDPALAKAEVILVTVPDAAISEVFHELAGRVGAEDGPSSTSVVLHASGARVPDESDEVLRSRVAGVGTFHPLLPLADPTSAAERLRGAWIGLRGDPAARRAGEQLARELGAHTLRVPDAPAPRARYHAAAVFASNFPVVLAAVAERLLVGTGVPLEAARGAVGQLMAAAVANVAVVGDPTAALTGPIARGDVGTVARHLTALAGDPATDALYRALAEATAELVGTRDSVRAAAVERVLRLPHPHTHPHTRRGPPTDGRPS